MNEETTGDPLASQNAWGQGDNSDLEAEAQRNDDVAEAILDDEVATIEPTADAIGSATAQAEASEPGFAAETIDGDRVMIVEKRATAAGDILVTADGSTYAADAANPSSTKVVPVDYSEEKVETE